MVVSKQFTLSSTVPLKIVEPSVNPQEVWIHNMSKSSNNFVHVGSSNVSTANSIHIDPGENMNIYLMPNDDLWAVSNPNGLTVGVLAVKQD
jgi:hypothetical protein